MKIFKKILSLFLCFLMGITGPVISSALADGYGNNVENTNNPSCCKNSASPCTPHCKDCLDEILAMIPFSAFLHNGSEYFSETDLYLPGIIPITIQRTYNSQSTFDSPMGYGWDYSFNERLRTYADNSVVIRNVTGIKSHFIFTGGVYICESSPHLTLIQNQDGSFVFYASPTGIKRYFDRDGRLVRKQDMNRNSLRMTYSNEQEALVGTSPHSITPNTPGVVSYNHQLKRVEQFDSNDASSGRFVDFNYDENSGRLTSIEDSTGRIVSYQHDTFGNLTRINYPEELFKSYEYTDTNDLHNMTNNLHGHGSNIPVLQVEREYDTDDRIILEKHAGGILEIDYTIPLQETKITVTVVNSQGETLHETETLYEFNADGYQINKLDNGKALEYVRDNRNNIVKRILSKNNGTISSPNLKVETEVTVIFDEENNIKDSSVLLEDGERIYTIYYYDNDMLKEQQLYSTATPDQIHKSIIEYNHLDNIPTTVAAAKILTGETSVPDYDSVSFQYNTANQQTAITFDNGDTISMEYDNGLLIRNENTIFSYDSRGNVISIEDANHHIMQYEYDDLGRNTKITNPLGEEIIFTYAGWDLTRIEEGKTVNQAGRITDLVYDDYGRMIQSSVNLEGSPVLQHTYTYDSDGNLLSVTDQQNRTETATYDPWGHLLSATDAEGNRSNYTYSPFGQLISSTNPLNQTTTIEYDKLSRPIKITNPLNGTTKIDYNALNEVIKVTDAESREFTFGYDLAGQMLWQKTPVSDKTWYQYDSKGRVEKVTLPDGTTNLYQYNKNDQLQEVLLASGTADSTTLRYGYDKMGNLIWYSDSSMGIDPLFNMSYDPLNRLETETMTPINKTLRLTYTPHGQRQELSVLDGATELFSYFYTYDTAGRLTSIAEEQQSATRTTSFASDNNGFLTGKTFPNGATANLIFSSNGLLHDLHFKKSDNSTINHFQYSYDTIGKTTGIIDTQGTTTFEYDLLNRLTTADYPVGSTLSDESFSYDQTGNRLTSTDVADWAYDAGGKLIAYNGHTLDYDKRGRQIAETFNSETVSYSYDNLDRLTEINTTGTQSQYSYDYANRRLRKAVNNDNRWYLYDGNNILAEFNNSGQLVRNNNYFPDSSDLLSISDGNNSSSVMTNHQQMPMYVLDDNQSVLWMGNYQAYGKASIENDVDNNGSTISLQSRFPGQTSDEETELYYNWNRFYNPETGRYLSSDPIGLNGGVNLFGYAMGSPTNNFDPNGLKTCKEYWHAGLLFFTPVQPYLNRIKWFADGVRNVAGAAAFFLSLGPLAAAATAHGTLASMSFGFSLGTTGTAGITGVIRIAGTPFISEKGATSTNAHTLDMIDTVTQLENVIILIGAGVFNASEKTVKNLMALTSVVKGFHGLKDPIKILRGGPSTSQESLEAIKTVVDLDITVSGNTKGFKNLATQVTTEFAKAPKKYRYVPSPHAETISVQMYGQNPQQ